MDKITTSFNTKPAYSKEIDKLCSFLIAENIPFEKQAFIDGYIVGVPKLDPKERKWDAVCHSGSYGHEDGLLEIMGTILTDEESEHDSVAGWLTAKTIISRIEKEKQNG